MKKERSNIYKMLVKAIRFLWKCMITSGPFEYIYDEDHYYWY